jgi:hypothetical protein
MYSRQFIAGPRPLSKNGSWKEVFFGRQTYVSCHPLLTVTRAAANEVEIVCLGHVLDPDRPALNDQSILDRIVQTLRTFDEFETATSRLGGRWLMFVRLGAIERIYPDAAGSKPVFYVCDEQKHELWTGSQPKLLSEKLGIPVDKGLTQQFFAHRVHNSWPAEVTPFAGVRRLLPNHHLTLGSGSSERFWPRSRVQAQDVEVAARTVHQILFGLTAAVLQRRRVALTVTGGYDSRVVLASAGSLRNQATLITVSGPDVAFGDVSIPRRLARRLGAKLTVVPEEAYDRAFWQTFEGNVAGMLWDIGSRLAYSFRHFDHSWFVLTGSIGEIARCFYYKNGLHPTELSADRLAAITGFSGNPVAVAAFDRWLKGAPRDANVNVLDLIYWEHRLANWLALALTGVETVCEPIAMYNCRHLLETTLGVDVAFRKSPYLLFRKICETAAPETLQVPFNDTLRDRLVRHSLSRVPWRVKSSVGAVRLRLAGFSPTDGLPPSATDPYTS